MRWPLLTGVLKLRRKITAGGGEREKKVRRMIQSLSLTLCLFVSSFFSVVFQVLLISFCDSDTFPERFRYGSCTVSSTDTNLLLFEIFSLE